MNDSIHPAPPTASPRRSPRLDPRAYFRPALRCALLAGLGALVSCTPRNAPEQTTREGKKTELLRAGSIVVDQADLEHALAEKHVNPKDEAARKKVLEELASRAQFAQAALDAQLLHDPEVRAQLARVLTARLKEQTLFPRLKELEAPIASARLHALYDAGIDRFRANEKRQVAVLWLNPNGDPQRTKSYAEKLGAAREWLLANADIKDHPEQGFSVLSVDHTEHAASRYKGGVVGWLEREGGMDAWSKAVAELAFALREPGEVSAVIVRPEGVFLVRYMAQKPALTRPFETVSAELERAERQRLRAEAEAKFETEIKAKYPVEWLGK